MVSFNRVRISGSSVGGEVWSTHADFATLTNEDVWVGIQNESLLNDWLAELPEMDAWSSNPSPVRQLLSGALSITQFRIEFIEDGELIRAVEASGLNLAGGLTDMTKVPQTSCVFSLTSARAGRSYRGRMYWPACGGIISTSTGRLSTPSTSETATQVAAILNEIAALSGEEDMQSVIWSPKLSEITPVRAVSVGDVLDTQRRRRDRLQEQRSTVAL